MPPAARVAALDEKVTGSPGPAWEDGRCLRPARGRLLRTETAALRARPRSRQIRAAPPKKSIAKYRSIGVLGAGNHYRAQGGEICIKMARRRASEGQAMFMMQRFGEAGKRVLRECTRRPSSSTAARARASLRVPLDSRSRRATAPHGDPAAGSPTAQPSPARARAREVSRSAFHPGARGRLRPRDDPAQGVRRSRAGAARRQPALPPSERIADPALRDPGSLGPPAAAGADLTLPRARRQ